MAKVFLPYHVRRRVQAAGILLGALFIVLGVIFQTLNAEDISGKSRAEVIFFDVGQGDSVLVQTPFGQNIVIGGGPDKTAARKIGRYLRTGERIHLLVLSHPHADHAAGLVPILEQYPVDRVLMNGVAHTTYTYRRFLDIVRERGIPAVSARAGQEFVFGDDVSLRVLYPFSDMSGKEVSEISGLEDGINDTSVVVQFLYQGSSFLFPGDISSAVEQRLAAVYGEGISSDVLKVSHHGSSSASSEVFLKTVRPQYGIISVGRGNQYGHPHAEVLRRLRQEGVWVMRTDEEGDIRFSADSGSILMR